VKRGRAGGLKSVSARAGEVSEHIVLSPAAQPRWDTRSPCSAVAGGSGFEPGVLALAAAAARRGHGVALAGTGSGHAERVAGRGRGMRTQALLKCTHFLLFSFCPKDVGFRLSNRYSETPINSTPPVALVNTNLYGVDSLRD
jgi:hypothetical protein